MHGLKMWRNHTLQIIGFATAVVSFSVLRAPGFSEKILISEGIGEAKCVFQKGLLFNANSIMEFTVPKGGKMTLIGHVENHDAGAWYPSAFWSRSRKFVVIENDGKPRLAYDFVSGRTFHHVQINASLKQHGGYGQTIFSDADDFSKKSHHPWLWEVLSLKR